MSGVSPSSPPGSFAAILALVVAAKVNSLHWPSVSPLATLRRDERDEKRESARDHKMYFILIIGDLSMGGRTNQYQDDARIDVLHTCTKQAMAGGVNARPGS